LKLEVRNIGEERIDCGVWLSFRQVLYGKEDKLMLYDAETGERTVVRCFTETLLDLFARRSAGFICVATRETLCLFSLRVNGQQATLSLAIE
jgi:hypothetical protein